MKEPKKILKPLFLKMNEKNISIFNNGENFIEWSSSNHKLFYFPFKQNVFLFFLVLKFFKNKFDLKIPKFVLFEIIKFVL